MNVSIFLARSLKMKVLLKLVAVVSFACVHGKLIHKNLIFQYNNQIFTILKIFINIIKVNYLI